MSKRAGLFAVIEGPSSAGKTTVTRLLHAELENRRLPVIATKEPSSSALGTLARRATGEYRGLALACLVAADRYHHLERDIRPALRAGYVVICDRYVPASLVLQQMDGAEEGFLALLNQYTDKPDLTVVLAGEPKRCQRRAADRGIYSRFHGGGIVARVAEDQLYRDVAHKLREAGYAVLHHEIADEPTEAVMDTVLQRLAQRSG